MILKDILAGGGCNGRMIKTEGFRSITKSLRQRFGLYMQNEASRHRYRPHVFLILPNRFPNHLDHGFILTDRTLPKTRPCLRPSHGEHNVKI